MKSKLMTDNTRQHLVTLETQLGLSSAQINAKDETAINEYNASFKEHQSGINELKRIKLEGLPPGLSLDKK